MKKSSYFYAPSVSQDIYEKNKPTTILQRLMKNLVKTKVLKNRTEKLRNNFTTLWILASNCQPGLEGYLVKCIPIFTFASKKVVIDLNSLTHRIRLSHDLIVILKVPW